MARIPIQIPGLLAPKNTFVGIDIGSSSVKLAEIAHRQGQSVLLKLRLHEIDPRLDAQSGQLDALKNLFRDINTRDAKISVVISCPQCCTRISVIPFMPESEILQALKWEMRDSVSIPMDHAVLDYAILQEIAEGGIRKLRLAVACCPTETVNKYLDLLSRAGIQPSVFTQHSFALKNIIGCLCPRENKTVALLDIGCNMSEFLIFEEGHLAFSRKLPVAGRDFTEELTHALVSEHGRTELTLAEAESIKRKYGIRRSDDSQILDDKVTNVQLVSLLRPNVEKLITEIERSFAYYREKELGSPVESLVLLGGGGGLRNLPQNLSEALHVPVRLANPLAAFPSGSSSVLNDEPEMAHRVASALGAAVGAPRDINLLPLEIRQRTKLLVKRSSMKALVTAGVVLMVLGLSVMMIKLGNYDKRIAAAELELNALSPQIKELPKQTFLCGILKKRIYWSDALKEISNSMSEYVCLTEMDAQEDTLTLKGKIVSPGLIREQVLTEFMRSLEKGMFTEVTLVSTKELPEDKLSIFELRLRIE